MLELELTKPIEELVPQLIAWNNEELLSEVKTRIAEYKGRVYDEDLIADAKADRATLNKFITALDNERKRIKKIYTAPLDKFTKEVNEVITAVDEVNSEIDKQVKAFDEKRKQEKQSAIIAYFEEVLPEELKDHIPYDKIHKKEWLNATKDIKAVKKEIDATIEGIKNDLTVLKNLSSEDVDELTVFYYDTLSLSQTLQENEKRKARAAQIAKLKAERAEAEQRAAEERKAAEEAAEKARLTQKAGETELPKNPFETESEPVKEPEPKLITVAFRATGTEEQIRALKRFIVDNGIKISKI